MEPKIETKDKEIKKESFSGPASYPISSWVSGGEAGSGFQPRDLTSIVIESHIYALNVAFGLKYPRLSRDTVRYIQEEKVPHRN